MSRRQRSAIFALAKTAGLDKDALHDLVWRVTAEDSIARLTNAQAVRVIDELKRLTGQAEPLGWLSSAQRGMIYALCRQLGWVTEAGAVDMARLEGFIRSRFRVHHIAWVRMEQGGRIIEALKSMVKGGRGERKGGRGEQGDTDRQPDA